MTISKISGTITTGVTLTSPKYADPVTITAKGNVSGPNGVTASSTWTIYNYGKISGTGYDADVLLGAGGSIINAAGGSIAGDSYGVETKGAAGAVDNAGAITSVTGIYLASGGSVTNAANASITGVFLGVKVAGAPGTIDNAGIIQATFYNGGEGFLGGGVTMTAGGVVTNAATGTITGPMIPEAIYIYGGTGSVENAGDISGKFNGVVIAAGGSLINSAGGSIRAAGDDGVVLLGASGSIYNAGAITASYSGGNNSGVYLYRGTLTNAASGSITSAANGVALSLSYPSSVFNAGVIVGTNGDGVNLFGGGYLTNTASGTITAGGYGIDAVSTYTTIENAGTITGGVDAIDLRANGVVVVDAGAVFNGDVVDTGGDGAIMLTATSGAGTLNGLGGKYQGFDELIIDPGALWTIEGTKAGFTAATIGGAPTNDTLVITDLVFAMGDKATITSGDVLEVLNSSQTVLESIALAPSVSLTGAVLKVAKDGGGTKVTITDPKLAYWEALGGGAWGAAASWSTGAVPKAASVSASILLTAPTPYDVTIGAGETYTVESLTVGSASADLVLQGALRAAGGLSLTAGSVSLEGGTLTGPASVAGDATMTGDGTITGAVFDNGEVEALGGALKITGAITGAGALQIDAGAILELGAGAGAIDFAATASPDQELILDKPTSSLGTLSGMAMGDTIDLKKIAATSETYSGDILSLFKGSQLVASLTIAGSFTTASFALASDNAGGVIVSLTGANALDPPPRPAGGASASIALFAHHIAAGLGAGADYAGMGLAYGRSAGLFSADHWLVARA